MNTLSMGVPKGLGVLQRSWQRLGLSFNLIVLGCFFYSSAWARLVSYPGGTTLMQSNNGVSSSVLLHHSSSAKNAWGYRAEWFRQSDQQFHGLQWNHLAKRWNQPKSQANVYVRSSVGINRYSDGPTQAAGFLGVSADWETRRWFTSYENRFFTDESSDFFAQKARIGLAPYVGDYGDWHTWVMLQFDHRSSQEPMNLSSRKPMNASSIPSEEATLLFRWFKGAYLGEAGFSNRGNALFNFIVRF